MRRKPSRRQRLFLTALRSTLGVAPAADAAGVSRATVYRWRTEDAAFAEMWDDAVEAALDDLEKALHERAKTKDTLAAIAILRNRRRSLYNDSTVQNQVNVQLNATVLLEKPDPATLGQALALLLGSGAVLPQADKVIEAAVEPLKLTEGEQKD